MKKTLLSLALAAMAMPAFATQTIVNVKDATDFDGTYVETTYKEDGSVGAYAHYQPINSLKLGSFDFSFTKGTSKTEPAWYTSKSDECTIRLYAGNTMTVSGAAIDGLVFTFSANADSDFLSTENGTVSFEEKTATWTAESAQTSIDFTIGKGIRILEVTFYTDGEKPATDEPAPSVDIADWSLTNLLGSVNIGDELTVCGYVTAVDARGFVVSDGAGSILVYQASGFEAKEEMKNCKVIVKGAVSAYNKGFQLSVDNTAYAIDTTPATGVPYPTVKVVDGAAMDAAIARTDNALAEYVQFKGLCSISGNYVNFTVDGAEKAQGSAYQIPAFIKSQLENAKIYNITGWFTSISSGKYYNVVITEVEEVPEEPTINEVNKLADILNYSNGDLINFNGEAVVVYQNGIYTWLQDASGSMLLYGETDEAVPGSVFAFFGGSYAPYNNLPEVKVTSVSMSDQTGKYNFKEIKTAGDYTAALVNQYLKLVNVKISDFEGQNATITFADGTTLALYNQLKIEGLEGGEYEAYYGFGGIYKETLQLTPIGPNPVEAGEPVTPPTSDLDIANWEYTSVIGEAADGKELLICGYVTGVDNRGFVVTDGGGSLLVYNSTDFTYDATLLNRKVMVKGAVSVYNTGFQIQTAAESYVFDTEVLEPEEVPYPAVKKVTGADMDAAIARTEPALAEYVEYEGVCSVSGNYVNFTVEGAETAQASAYMLPADEIAKFQDGHTYTIRGWFMAVSGGKFYNTVVVEYTDITSVKGLEISENIAIEGRNIIAPAGAEIYSINGVRVSGRDLMPGVYVVRCDGKAAKVLVK